MLYDGITLQEDTRQQAEKHEIKDRFFQDHSIKILRSKLPYGDYALLGDWRIVIDTKKDFMELEGNLTKDHVRFRNEIIGANEHGIYIIILIEEDYNYISLDEFAQYYKIPRWKSTTNLHKKGQPMAQFNVETIVKVMKTMQEKYQVLFLFTTKEDCPQKILDILTKDKDKYISYFEKRN